eukprot:3119666-Pyramimonas_sp.AAC.1
MGSRSPAFGQTRLRIDTHQDPLGLLADLMLPSKRVGDAVLADRVSLDIPHSYVIDSLVAEKRAGEARVLAKN